MLVLMFILSEQLHKDGREAGGEGLNKASLVKGRCRALAKAEGFLPYCGCDGAAMARPVRILRPPTASTSL